MIQIAVPEAKVGEFCRKWKVTELALFGSVLREDFRPASDVDVLVSFEPQARWRLLEQLISCPSEHKRTITRPWA